MKTALVLDALEQALWTRRRDGSRDLAGLVHHTDAGSQYTSIAFTERLAAAGVSASVGTVGDAYDNALAESVIGLFKTELIKPRGPWRTAEQVEIATLEYVDWFNHRRLYETCGDIPPAELEAAYYSQNDRLAEAAVSQTESPDSPGRFMPTCCQPRGWKVSAATATCRVTSQRDRLECDASGVPRHRQLAHRYRGFAGRRRPGRWSVS